MKKFIGGLLIAATMLTPIAPVFAQARDGQQIAQRGDGNGNGNGGNRGNRGNRGQGDNRSGGGDRAQRQQAPRPQAQPQMQRQQGQRQQVQRQQGQRPQGQQPQRRDWSGNRDGQVQRQQGQRPQVQRQQGQRQDRNRGTYDRNNDGRVDRQWDRNRNGQVDRQWDRNRNGQVDRRYDRNRNGQVDRRDGRYDRRYDRNDNNRGDRRYGNNRNGNWNRQWRDDRRYNWRDYRQQYGNRYRLGSYYSPYRNHRYTRFSIGFTLGSLYYGQRYWINDPWQYRLPPADGGYRWVRYYDDVLLVDTYSGEVVDVIYDFFW